MYPNRADIRTARARTLLGNGRLDARVRHRLDRNHHRVLSSVFLTVSDTRRTGWDVRAIYPVTLPLGYGCPPTLRVRVHWIVFITVFQVTRRCSLLDVPHASTEPNP